jgi:hypothetical protein
MFKKEIQLSIMLENVPGRLAELCELLYESGVGIQALAATPIGDAGIVRVVVDDSEGATRGLDEQNIPYLQTEVLVALMPNEQGMAAGLGHRFTEAGVNIEYTYFSGGEVGTRALLVFKVNDVDQALDRLESLSGNYN